MAPSADATCLASVAIERPQAAATASKPGCATRDAIDASPPAPTARTACGATPDSASQSRSAWDRAGSVSASTATLPAASAAAQLAAELLAPQNGDRILDACAAPGGKTGHLLEYCPEPELLIALDKDGARVGRIQENLERLGRSAELVDEDAAEPEKWWDGTPFDRILLDVPCSATGVIRRHPDIKWLRQEDDIKALQQEQARILKAIWPLLKPGGRLVYATCSILPVENSEQIDHFLKTHNDAREETIDADWGRACQHGRQILPGEDDMDGFYYACLSKSTD